MTEADAAPHWGDDTVVQMLCLRNDELEREKEALAAKLDRAEEELAILRSQAEALHRIGSALDLRPGADLTTEALPAVQALAADVERLHNALDPKLLDWIDCGMAANNRHKEAWARELRNELHQALAETPANSLARLKAQCWKEAYLAGMEAGHHWTVEGGYVAGGDEEAAEDYVADRQAEGDAQ